MCINMLPRDTKLQLGFVPADVSSQYLIGQVTWINALWSTLRRFYIDTLERHLRLVEKIKSCCHPAMKTLLKNVSFSPIFIASLLYQQFVIGRVTYHWPRLLSGVRKLCKQCPKTKSRKLKRPRPFRERMARRCKYIDIMPSRLKLLNRIIFWTRIYCLIYKAARWYKTYLWSDLSMIDDRFEVGGAMSWHINACHRYGGHSEVGSSIEPLSDPTTTPRLQSDTHHPSDTQSNIFDPSDIHDKSYSHTIPPE